MKTTLLFLATNMGILAMVTIVMRVFGVEAYLQSVGLHTDLTVMLIIAAVVGMAGSFISLMASKSMAKRMPGLRVIEQTDGSTERWLLDTVTKQAEQAGIGMPEVAIMDSAQPNAFATGSNRDNALVAVSTGLLNSMSKEEVEAVVGHEISHVANGDMLRLTLIQGVVNTFVFFFSRIIGQFVDRAIFKNERGRGIGFFVATLVAQMVLGVFASMIVMWFSRYREFRADEGGAKLAGTGAMIGALQRLRDSQDGVDDLPEQLAAFAISGTLKQGFAHLFASHPPLEERIARLSEGYSASDSRDDDDPLGGSSYDPFK